MKIVYIAHPVKGDKTNNIVKIVQICRRINLSNQGIVPFAPYISDCLALSDDIHVERQRGLMNDAHYFNLGIIDELWLYGDHLSPGMIYEIDMAIKHNIPIFAKTEEIANILHDAQ